MIVKNVFVELRLPKFGSKGKIFRFLEVTFSLHFCADDKVKMRDFKVFSDTFTLAVSTFGVSSV